MYTCKHVSVMTSVLRPCQTGTQPPSTIQLLAQRLIGVFGLQQETPQNIPLYESYEIDDRSRRD